MYVILLCTFLRYRKVKDIKFQNLHPQLFVLFSQHNIATVTSHTKQNTSMLAPLLSWHNYTIKEIAKRLCFRLKKYIQIIIYRLKERKAGNWFANECIYKTESERIADFQHKPSLTNIAEIRLLKYETKGLPQKESY